MLRPFVKSSSLRLFEKTLIWNTTFVSLKWMATVLIYIYLYSKYVCFTLPDPIIAPPLPRAPEILWAEFPLYTLFWFIFFLDITLHFAVKNSNAWSAADCVCSLCTGVCDVHVCSLCTGVCDVHVCSLCTGVCDVHVCSLCTGVCDVHVCSLCTGVCDVHVCREWLAVLNLPL
jgi:hypothetical protein